MPAATSASVRPSSSDSACRASGKIRTRSAAWSAVERTSIAHRQEDQRDVALEVDVVARAAVRAGRRCRSWQLQPIATGRAWSRAAPAIRSRGAPATVGVAGRRRRPQPVAFAPRGRELAPGVGAARAASASRAASRFGRRAARPAFEVGHQAASLPSTIVVAEERRAGRQLEQQVGDLRARRAPLAHVGGGSSVEAEVGVRRSASRKPPGARRRSRPRSGCRASAAGGTASTVSRPNRGSVGFSDSVNHHVSPGVDDPRASQSKPTSRTFGGRWTWNSVCSAWPSSAAEERHAWSGQLRSARLGLPHGVRDHARVAPDQVAADQEHELPVERLVDVRADSSPVRHGSSCRSATSSGCAGPERVEVGAALVGRVLAPQQLAAPSRG